MFDLKTLKKNKLLGRASVNESDFYDFICRDVLERLLMIDHNFKDILILQPIT
ncbi:MAG: hypothetical protein DGJ47_001044, partial [Rickettsiaceae bacterium]